MVEHKANEYMDINGLIYFYWVFIYLYIIYLNNKGVKMKITDIKIGKISVPLKTSFKTALRTVNSVEDIIVEVKDTGHVGYGEVAPTGVITGDTTGAIKDHIIILE
ncbi:hypothetical protein TPHSE_23110 [Terrisporobacter petrolearius]